MFPCAPRSSKFTNTKSIDNFINVTLPSIVDTLKTAEEEKNDALDSAFCERRVREGAEETLEKTRRELQKVKEELVIMTAWRDAVIEEHKWDKEMFIATYRQLYYGM
tara:strand:+ start:1719 stop:2039 length:321 start_codon:yes stop_codon:yes gene_type:complete